MRDHDRLKDIMIKTLAPRLIRGFNKSLTITLPVLSQPTILTF